MEVDLVKVNGVAIATPTVVGCVPVSIEHVVDINHYQIKGVTLKDPTVAACLPVSIEHVADINHAQILGTALKTPTYAQCVPISVENDAIAYDDANDRFYVDLAKISATDVLAVSATDLDIRALTEADVVTVKSITNALPAGTNAIGKLAANSGVDIGDVDVLTMPEVTQDTRTSLKAQTEREDLISLGGTSTPNAAGVQIIAPNGTKKIKVYDAGYECTVDGLHYFYFGTTTTPTTRAFCTRKTAGPITKTFVEPRVSNAGDGLYVYSAVNETEMDWDLGYVQE